MRRRFAAVALALLAAFFVLDRLLFGWLIFQPANHSGWDSYPWYNFERQFRRIEAFRAANPQATLVLVPGSSISKYSVNERLLEALLAGDGVIEPHVFTLQHASMLPADLYYYSSRIAALAPDLILLITGPADLDLERYAPPWEASPDYSDFSAESYLNLRRPGAIFYPGGLALHSPLPNKDQRLSLLGRSALFSARFRNEWYEPWRYWRDNSEPLRRYLYYQGAALSHPIWRDGFTRACFEAPPSFFPERVATLETPAGLAGRAALRIFAARQQPAAGDLPLQQLQGEFWEQGGPSRPIALREYATLARRYIEQQSQPLHCQQPLAARPLAELRLDRVGWNDYSLPPLAEGEGYFFQLSHSLDAEGRAVAGLADGRGLRLPGNLGLLQARVDDFMVRRPAWEDYRLQAMDRAQYAADYYGRIEPDDWRSAERVAFHQLNSLRLSRYYTAWYPWSESFQARKLRAFVEAMPPSTRFVIVENPENPLAQGDYDSQWRRGYSSYLQSLLDGRYPAHVRFLRLVDELPEQYFLDPHHLSHAGVLRIAPVYAAAVSDVFRAPRYGR
ncbi:MAG: hypothetical protein K1X75_07180 [Leptospirales bacterium]|nr:hypothetical protein [Leptospirales bacterium]